MANDITTYSHEGMELPFEDWSNKLHSLMTWLQSFRLLMMLRSRQQ
ncbi:MAG: hypothetical protein UHS55_08635 [Prevotella sp.]|nr:hypothetical protein [Prevotella sp.]